MATIQVREYEDLKIGAHDPSRRVLSGAQAHALGRLEPTLPKGAIRWGHKTVKFGQFCGIIALGADSIEILPKLYGLETEPGVSRQILVKMLYAARLLSPSLHGAANIELQQLHLLDVFISHFCGLLYEQVHQGLIKVYVEKEANLSVVRGRMLLGQQVKSNLAHNERVYCAFDELQEDNGYNRAIKATVRLLYGMARARRLRQALNELLYIFGNIRNVRVTAADVRKLPRNRLVSRYDEVLKLCEWFLSGFHPDVVVGKNPAVALLFDMNRLFESFIASEMRRVVKRQGYTLRAQGPQRYLGQEEATKKKLFLLKPDLTVLDSKGRAAFIGDTKWKRLDESDAKYGVHQPDIYQMLVYGTQYECRRLALIYPSHAALGEESHAVVIRRGNYRVEVWTIDLAGLAGVGPSVESQLEMRMAAGDGALGASE